MLPPSFMDSIHIAGFIENGGQRNQGCGFAPKNPGTHGADGKACIPGSLSPRDR